MAFGMMVIWGENRGEYAGILGAGLWKVGLWDENYSLNLKDDEDEIGYSVAWRSESLKKLGKIDLCVCVCEYFFSLWTMITNYVVRWEDWG
jgi:hypothetical protein